MIPVPGHPFPGAVDFEKRLSYDAGPYTDTNIFTDAGEPTVAIALHVYVAAGVVMGASTISSSAMTFEGFQSLPSGEDPEDIQTSFWIEKAQWHDDIIEALIYSLEN